MEILEAFFFIAVVTCEECGKNRIFAMRFFPLICLMRLARFISKYARESCINEMRLDQCASCDERFHSSEIDEDGFCKNCAESNCADWQEIFQYV